MSNSSSIMFHTVYKYDPLPLLEEEELFCPYCASSQITSLPEKLLIAPLNFKYLCNSCNSRFSLDAIIAFGNGVHFLDWVKCWYWMGQENSYQVIADNLGTDADTIKSMMEALHILNKTQARHNLDFIQWIKHALADIKKIQENFEVLKSLVCTPDIAKIPHDTAEYRRVKERNKSIV